MTALKESQGTESVATYPEEDDQGIERPTDLAPGETVADRYTVLSTLGRGGYASVYLARDETTGTNVALKVLRVDRLNPVALKRMSREADTARAFQHDRLVHVLDFGRFGDNAFLAMEPVLGQTLRDRMRAGALSIDETIRIAEDVLQGLSALHQQGIVHRDVKPSNILLDHEGRAKLADFGLVTAWADDQSRATQSRAIVGTVEYVSPEQALGEPLDGRSDLYSLGVVLYEMLSGAPLHGARSSLGMLVAHLTKPAPDVRTSRENIPEWLARVTARLLEKDRDQRYPSTDAALADLKAMRASGRLSRDGVRPGLRTVAVIGAIAATLGFGWWNRPGAMIAPAPALSSVEVKEGILRGLDSKGTVLWTHNFAVPLDDSSYTPQALLKSARLRVADLDGDGRNEVLITTPTEHDGLLKLFVLESDGAIRFERKPGRALTYGDGVVYADFTAQSTHVFVDRRGRTRLFLLSVHRPWFPTVLEELSPQGRLLSEYVASGGQTNLTRFPFRGRDALVLSGFHNETRGGSVTFLSLDQPGGRSPAMNPTYLCTACEQADPLAVIVAPGSDVLRASSRGEGSVEVPRVILIDGGAIDVTADHGPYSDVDGTKDRASVSYTLNPDATRITSVRVSTFLRTIHDNMFKLGRLDHRFDDRDDRALSRVLTWDAKKWSPLPAK